MNNTHRSVIAKLSDVELIDIVSQDIEGNDCYRVASDIITSEPSISIQTQRSESQKGLNRLMAFQKALRNQEVKVSYIRKV